jgi:hypothetical protein
LINWDILYHLQAILIWLDSLFNPLPSGTLATFFLTAVGPIQHTKEGDISREKTILMTSLRLERAAAVRWRPLLITPLPPKCKGQCVQSNVMTQVRANRAAAVRKQRSSGRRCRTRSPMVSLEPPWKDASIDTPNTLIRGPWGRQNYFLLNQRYLRPPMSDTAADGLIETAMKIRIYRDPTHPDQRPLRPPTPFRHTYNFSRQINRSKRAAAVRYCGDL